jgi:hypothetical protein
MSDRSLFVGNWTIRAVGGEVVWPFELENRVVIGEPLGDIMPVEVTDHAGTTLDKYQGVYSDESGGLQLLTVTVVSEGAVYTLNMTVLSSGPTTERLLVLEGNWIPAGTTITKGTWVGNEGGVPLPYEEQPRVEQAA